ncbi:metal-dependent transcriptional regulator [Anaerovorax odorimutans]|uniref:metal-dependent transcriptional regulator n=1 Tax=Anaerovorax odorimutans TaxID=109327 RepID=UPI00042828B7|nr:metal-dependent transcriptional regulator [Anaerovorax odorimutans]
MELHKSGEDYLKIIYKLKVKKGNVRAVDISLELGVTKPSVSRAVKVLKQMKYIYTNNNDILLTSSGEKIAKQIYERYQLISKVLENDFKISSEISKHDACLLEHDISDETYRKIRDHILLFHR